MKVTISPAAYTTDAKGEEIETVYEIECGLTPYVAAYISGPPEKCYPAEGGECEIIAVRLGKMDIPSSEWAARGIDLKKVEEQAWEAAPSKEDDDPPERDDD